MMNTKRKGRYSTEQALPKRQDDVISDKNTPSKNKNMLIESQKPH